MAKTSSQRTNPPQRLPDAAAPSAAHAPDGVKSARELARRYLPDTVRLLAGIALRPDSEAALDTRLMAAKDIVASAGAIPQATPTPPPYEGAGDGSDPD